MTHVMIRRQTKISSHCESLPNHEGSVSVGVSRYMSLPSASRSFYCCPLMMIHPVAVVATGWPYNTERHHDPLDTDTAPLIEACAALLLSAALALPAAAQI